MGAASKLVSKSACAAPTRRCAVTSRETAIPPTTWSCSYTGLNDVSKTKAPSCDSRSTVTDSPASARA